MKSNPRPAPTQTSRPLLLACLAFGLGIALAGIWFHRPQAGAETGGLSASTKNMLGQLPTPVTLRYYSLLPAGSADEALQAFAGRVEQLLNAMQTASGGKLQMTTIDKTSEASANAAGAAGLQAFNLEKGDACFLGLAIAGGKNSEVFARLQPEWEAALEFDLARAIQRVAAVPPPAPLPAAVAKPSAEITASINRLIPDVSAVSTEQADQIFRAEFVKQCGEVGAEVEAQIKAAQQQVVNAQNNGDAAALAAAQKNLAQVQLAQVEKFKAIAADLQTRLAVFQQLKAGATNAAK